MLNIITDLSIGCSYCNTTDIISTLTRSYHINQCVLSNTGQLVYWCEVKLNMWQITPTDQHLYPSNNISPLPNIYHHVISCLMGIINMTTLTRVFTINYLHMFSLKLVSFVIKGPNTNSNPVQLAWNEIWNLSQR